jgi:hypothetical protein
MGHREQMDQRRAMEQACDTKTLKDILNDHKTSVFGPSQGVAAKVVPADAGRVTTGTDGSGWVAPATHKSWFEMSAVEREELERERARESAARKAAAAKGQS